MKNKVELFDHGSGQKMGCNKLLKNEKMDYKLLKKQQMGSMLSATDMEVDLWAY